MFALPILIGATVAGTAVSATGQIKAGNAAKAAGEAEAQRDEFNASVAQLQAKDALAAGAQQESQLRAQVRGLIGSQRAGFASQGVMVGSGSAADVQADTAYLGEIDAQTIRANAQRQAWGYQVEAQDQLMAADVARKGGQAAQTASRYGALATGLNGVQSLALLKYGYSRS